MKKLLSILVVSILLIGCSEDRVLIDELTNKGGKLHNNGKIQMLMYNENGLYDGIGFDVSNSGQLIEEVSFKSGIVDGFWKGWYDNGQLSFERSYIDGEKNGLHKGWYDNGQLMIENYFKDGEFEGSWKEWYSNEHSIQNKQLFVCPEHFHVNHLNQNESKEN